jgi:hypothetical protein
MRPCTAVIRLENIPTRNVAWFLLPDARQGVVRLESGSWWWVHPDGDVSSPQATWRSAIDDLRQRLRINGVALEER